ncbi:MAG TPA: hypothetical protein VFK02_37020 [Kofleriaceae bacterium]|nr:hypothetical protein [Kofleriaceae bacterium]
MLRPAPLAALVVAVVPAVISAIVLAPGTARADEPPPPPSSTPPAEQPIRGQRSIGIGAEAGFSTGVGGALHLGMSQYGLYVSSGLVPLLIFGNKKDASRSLTFDVYGAVELNTDAYLMFLEGPRSDVGICAGYSGNTVLGNGFNIGIAVRYDLAEKIAFTIFGGFEVFPGAADHLTAHGYPSAMQDAAVPYLQGGANLGIVFYP